MHSATISNLAPATTEASIRQFLSFVPGVASIDLHTDEASATVYLRTEDDLRQVLLLNEYVLDGQPVQIAESADAHMPGAPTSASSGDDFAGKAKEALGTAGEACKRGWHSFTEWTVQTDRKLGERVAEVDTTRAASGKEVHVTRQEGQGFASLMATKTADGAQRGWSATKTGFGKLKAKIAGASTEGHEAIPEHANEM